MGVVAILLFQDHRGRYKGDTHQRWAWRGLFISAISASFNRWFHVLLTSCVPIPVTVRKYFYDVCAIVGLEATTIVLQYCTVQRLTIVQRFGAARLCLNLIRFYAICCTYFVVRLRVNEWLDTEENPREWVSLDMLIMYGLGTLASVVTALAGFHALWSVAGTLTETGRVEESIGRYRDELRMWQYREELLAAGRHAQLPRTSGAGLALWA